MPALAICAAATLAKRGEAEDRWKYDDFSARIAKTIRER
jgi:hypothetical protein